MTQQKKPVAKATQPAVITSFGTRHYVPILKSKAGELWAIGRLSAVERDHITPLFEVHREGQKTLADHSARVMASISTARGDLPFFIDTFLHGVSGAAAVGAAQTILQAAVSETLQFVPVTSLDRSAAYQNLLVNYLSRGVMLRLKPENFLQVQALATMLDTLIAGWNIPRSSIDILIDCGAVGNPTLQSAEIRSMVNSLPSLMSWRTVTVAGSAFPSSIATQPANQWNALPRREWASWQGAVTATPMLKRLPSYGDYGVRDTAPPAEFGSPYANIRYTTNGLYLVRRNDVLVKDGGSTDIYAICTSLRARAEFSGPAFSAGDERIEETAVLQASTGNAGNWTQWAMSHHFATVVGEILTLLAA